MRIEDLLARLNGVRSMPNGSWIARCPSHDDHNPSLTVRIGSAGSIFLKCHSNKGCTFDSIRKALGLRSDEVLRLPGVERPSKEGAWMESRIAATFDYKDQDGNFVFQVVRYEPKTFSVRHRNASGGWEKGIGDKPCVLYNLPAIMENPRRHVVVVEGEKDAERLIALDILATTAPLGSGKWRKEYGEHLRGREVSVIADNDTSGLRHAQEVAFMLLPYAKSVRIILLKELGDKEDVSDWLDKHGGTREELIKRCRETIPINALALEPLLKQNNPEPTNTPAPLTPATVAQALLDQASKMSSVEWVIYARGRIGDLENSLYFDISTEAQS